MQGDRERHFRNINRQSPRERIPPRESEAVGGPGLTIGIDEDDGAALRRGVQRGLQRRAYRDNNGNSGLGLLEGDPLAVTGGPGEAKQVTLPLPGPQSELQRKVKVPRCSVEEGELVIKRPDLVAPRAAIEAPSPLTGIGYDKISVERPR